MLPQMEFHELVGLVQIKETVAAEIETNEIHLQIAEGVAREAQFVLDRTRESDEATHVKPATWSVGLEHLRHQRLEALPIAQKIRNVRTTSWHRPDGRVLAR